MKAEKLFPQFPLYIPSKGRHEYMVTSKALTEMGIRHFIVVEPQQVEDYERAVYAMKLMATIVPLDMSYKSRYELCDDLGLTKSTGSGPARNFAWDHSIRQGFDRHWIMDDNIKCFRRMHMKERIKTTSPSFWRAMEDFVCRYKNVSMAGPNYSMFAFGAASLPPFITNTRIYSCNLIRNDVPFRWRGRYNEDTILSLDMLKAGWVTVQFNAFLQEKMQTQSLPGGNTTELYQGDNRKNGEKYSKTGTIAKSQMLARVHPDVAEMVWKFDRWHHHVDYTPFKRNKLIFRDGIKLESGTNEYGMQLVKIRK